MRKLFLCSLILFLCTALNVGATIYVGDLVGGTGGDLIATGGWDSPESELSWRVFDPSDSGYTDLWKYEYTFKVPTKDISHVNIEVSDFFTDSNVKDDTTLTPEKQPDESIIMVKPSPQSHTSGNGNPGIPEPMYGLKWDLTSDTTTFTWLLISDIAPMWGDFYAKDGTDGPPGDKIDVYAYNSAFEDDSRPVFDFTSGDLEGWVLVPDTNPIPEPATMLLVGSGLIGLAGFGKKKFFKK